MSKKEAGYRPSTIKIRRNAAAERWQPATWQPEYEAMVALSCRGFSNTYISEVFKLTPVHVSNVLNCDEAKEIKAQFVAAVRADSMKTAEEQMNAMHDRAVKNMHEVLNNEDLLKTAPFAVFDRSKAFLTGVGKMKSDKAGEGGTTNNIMISDALGTRILEGLAKSQEAKRLHAGLSGESIN